MVDFRNCFCASMTAVVLTGVGLNTGSGTGGILGNYTLVPIVSKSLAIGCLTYGASLGSIAICISPRVTKSRGLGILIAVSTY